MNVKKRVFAAAAVMALAAAGVLISGSHNIAQAGPGSAPVSITSPLPLPITGTATVSGTVGATQSGTWNVGISGTPNVTAAQGGTWNVNVANSPAFSLAGTPTVNANVTGTVAVRNVDEKGRIPYMQSVQLSCPTSELCDAVYPPVPAGMRLVVEHVSADIFVNPGGVNATLLLGANGTFLFSLPGRSMAAPNLVGVNEQVLAYYEAGEQPTYRVAFSMPSQSGSVGSTISGYLINLSQ